MRRSLLEKRFWRKGIRGAFQGIFRAWWPWTYFLGCSLSAAPSPLQIRICLHGSFFCFWSGGNWCGGSWFGFRFLSSLGHWRVLSDVCRDRCCHWLWYVYCCWCRWFCRGWCRWFCRGWCRRFCRGWCRYFCRGWCRCFYRRGSCGLVLGFLGRFLFFFEWLLPTPPLFLAGPGPALFHFRFRWWWLWKLLLLQFLWRLQQLELLADLFLGGTWICAPTACSSNSADVCLPQSPSSASLCWRWFWELLESPPELGTSGTHSPRRPSRLLT